MMFIILVEKSMEMLANQEVSYMLFKSNLGFVSIKCCFCWNVDGGVHNPGGTGKSREIFANVMVLVISI